jgi:WbqC-like protein
MTRQVVISQSMYFPWVGLLEQVRLADCFVHYDDVQFARGFFNRVQIKTENGIRWMTVPLRDRHRDQKIDEITVDNRGDWRQQHRDVLRQAYREAPFRNDLLALIDAVFDKPLVTLADVSRASTLQLAEYFDLTGARSFVNSRDLNIGGSSSQRLLDIVVCLEGDTYITGHGARNYLDHDLFERAGVTVHYMKYECVQYPQLHGPFTPYVSGLDLVANCGKNGKAVIKSSSIDWRAFTRGPA